MFSYQEYCDMVLIYGECEYNGNRVREMYRERFPNRRLPSKQTFLDSVQRLRDTGSLIPTCEGRGQTQQRPKFEEQVMDLLEEDPSQSTRDLSREIGISHMTVSRILQGIKSDPYYAQREQQLINTDLPRRLEFCQWFHINEARYLNFPENIIFTDECCFTRDGILNYHNAQYLSIDKSHTIRLKGQFSIIVWAGILGDRLLGPFILPPRLNGNLYLEFLEDTLPDILEDIPLATRRILWYMHDGAPPHVTAAVRNFLNNQFPCRWISKQGPIAWPPCSSDMNPLNYFFWAFMKRIVYSAPVESLDELQQRIIDAADYIRNGYLTNVTNALSRRIRACMQMNGDYFEHLL